MDESHTMDYPQHITPPPATDLDICVLGSRKKPAPLNTARLKPFRQATKRAILTILETGHVSVEVVKRKGEQETVVELFVVSGDGQQICMEQTKQGDGGFADNLSNLNQSWKTFNYETLPEKLWKKYSHAVRFVELVKSKTAKVTMYSDRAKGVLMENWPPSFEASFFGGGPKVVLVDREVHIMEDSGASLLFHCHSLHSLINTHTMDLIQHATQMREQCVRLESSVMTVQRLGQNSEQLFPVTVGMRPSTSFCSSTSSNSGSMDLVTCPHLHSSPPTSQAHIVSPPPSPLPHLDHRFPETPRKVMLTPHSSPASNRSTSMTSESPLRHVSTLEGRKMRCRTSASADSSFLEYYAHPATNSSQHFRHFIGHSLDESDSRHNVSTGHGLANSQVFGAEIERNQHFLTSTPCCARAQRRTAEVTPSTPAMLGLLHNVTPSSLPCQLATCDTAPPRTGAPFLVAQQQNCMQENGSPCADRNSAADSLTASAHAVSTSVTRNQPSTDSGLDEQGSQVLCQTFVAYTGWATQFTNGSICIRYNDGTQLGINRNQTEVVYIDQEGCRHR
ncbi:serine/threonine-protein kinase PLK4-like isoform X2 [Littorina saxatilis]